MNATLLKALVALLPVSLLFSGSILLFRKGRTANAFLQLIGTGCLLLAVLTHVSEALHLFPWMGWGMEDGVGHYIDLSSAVLGLTTFPVGYLLQALNLSK